MKRLLLFGIGAGALGAVVCARGAGEKCGSFDFEKMIERMPENAPPKWMFRNISTIRANTDRILELLETSRVPSTGGQKRTAA
jgi:hypothetical protein